MLGGWNVWICLNGIYELLCKIGTPILTSFAQHQLHTGSLQNEGVKRNTSFHFCAMALQMDDTHKWNETGKEYMKLPDARSHRLELLSIFAETQYLQFFSQIFALLRVYLATVMPEDLDTRLFYPVTLERQAMQSTTWYELFKGSLNGTWCNTSISTLFDMLNPSFIFFRLLPSVTNRYIQDLIPVGRST